MFFFKKSAKPKEVVKYTVSSPYSLTHPIHVDFNSATGFSGLPKEWEVLLKHANISKTDVLANPQQVLDILDFHSEMLHQQEKDEDPKPLPPEKNNFSK